MADKEASRAETLKIALIFTIAIYLVLFGILLSQNWQLIKFNFVLEPIQLVAIGFILSAIPYHTISESMGIRSQIARDWESMVNLRNKDLNDAKTRSVEKMRTSLTTVQRFASISITLTIFVAGLMITQWTNLTDEFQKGSVLVMIGFLAAASMIFLVLTDSYDSSLDPQYVNDLRKLKIFRLKNLDLFQIGYSFVIWAVFFGTMALSPYIPLIACPAYTLSKAYYQIAVVEQVK